MFKFITKKAITIFILIFIILGGFSVAQNSKAAINKQFNYQGKLTDSSRVAVTDGVYNIVFKLYTQAGGGTETWTENWNTTLWTQTDPWTSITADSPVAGLSRIFYTTDTNDTTLKAGQTLWNITKGESAPIYAVDTGSNYIDIQTPYSTWATTDHLTNRIYIRDGLFSVMLGSITSLPEFTSADYYLGVTIGTDDEMIPRKRIGAVPQAWNANNVVGDGYVDIDNISTAQDAVNINYDPASGSFDAMDIIYGSGGTGNALTITQSGTGNVLLLNDEASDTTPFVIDGNGNVGIGTDAPTEKLHLDEGNFLQTPGDPTLVGSLSVGTSPYSVYVSGRYAYVVDNTSDDLKVIDVSNPAIPTLAGSLSVGSWPVSVYVSGRYAYVIDMVSGDLKIIDISNSFAPILAGSLSIGFSPASVYVSGRYAYVVASSNSSLEVIDVSNPAIPTLAGSLSVGSWPVSVYVSGRYAYVIDRGSSDLNIIDVSNPAIPTLAGSLSVGSWPVSVYVSGRYAYVIDQGSSGLKVIDVSNPAIPTLAGSLAIGSSPKSVYVSGRYAYVVDQTSDDLKVIDVSNPTSPILSGSLSIGSLPISVYVSGRYAYVVDYDSDDLKVIDVSGMETTSMMAHSLEAGNLQVRNDILAQGQLQVTGGITAGSGGIYSQGNVGISTSSTSTTLSVTQSGAGDIVNFFDGTSEVFTILDGGNVGLGIDTPTSNLHIYQDSPTADKILFQIGTSDDASRFSVDEDGDVSFDGTITSGGGIIATGNILPATDNTYDLGSSTYRWQDLHLGPASLNIYSTTGTAGATSDYTLGNVGFTSDALTITTTNAGSGTGGQINLISAYPSGNTTTSAFNLTTSTDLGVADELLQVGDSAGAFMTILGNGDVGIGTDIPTEKLHLDEGNFLQTPGNLTLVGSLSIGASPRSVYVSGRYAYVVDTNSGDLKIIDVSNPTDPTLSGSLSLGDWPASVYVSGRYAYVVDSTSDDLKVIDVSNPASPTLAGNLVIGTNPLSVYVSGRYAYVVDQASDDLKVIDVSNPASPTLAGSLSIGTAPNSVYVSGRYAYVVDVISDDLKVIDISNPASPTLSGSLSIGAAPRSVYVSGRYAYVVDYGSDDLKVIDVSNPAIPTLVPGGSLSLGAIPYSVYVSGRYAYVVDQDSDDLKVIDISNPASPTLSGSLSIGATPVSVYVSGRYAYVVDQDSGDLKVIDVSGMETTSMMAHSLEAGNLQVRNDILAQGQLQVTGGITAGSGGIYSQGNVGISTSSTSTTLTVTQSGTGNIVNLVGDSITTGTGIALSLDSLTTGTGFDISSTSIGLTSGELLSVDWSPGSAITATGDLFNINIGADGTIGNLFNVTDTDASIFSVSQSAITMNRPIQVNVAGNTGMSYDLNFMNTGLSQITSEGPLMISAGDSNHYENLTLTTGGTGDIVMDIADSLIGLKVLGSADGGYAMKLSPTGNMDLSQNLAMTGGILTVAELNASDLGTPATSTATSGGSCADSTIYYYKITALNGNGETTGTTEFNETTGASGSNINTITVSWVPVHGATGYKVYRSTETDDWDSDGSDVLVDDTTISAGTTTLTDNCSDDAINNSPPSTNSTGGRIGINIADATPDARIEVLDADSGNPQMRLAQSDNTNYADFEVDATGDLTITMSGDDLIIDDNLKVCSGACPTTGYSITGTGNLVVENRVVADSFERICADGYVWVPGSAKFGTMPGFCVMKYEAKGSTGAVVSTSTGLPYVSISQENARAECIGIGAGYHLISEPEWMTIAENIVNLPINDLDSDAELQLATGHSDNADAGAVANAVASIDTADPIVSGCTLTLDMENAANVYSAGSCEIRGDSSHGTDPGDANDKGFYDTGQDWADATYVSGAANKSQLRTHVLSSGEVIWDIAGNVYEWTDALSIAQEHPVDATPASEWLAYAPNDSTIPAITKYGAFSYIRPPNEIWNGEDNGVGRLYSGYDDGTDTNALIRGGYWSGGEYSGVFTFHVYSPSNTSSTRGFRCAR